MSFVGSMFSNGKGAGFEAGGAPIQQAVNTGMTNNAYNQTQSGLSQQQAFLNALQAQGGINNQANVFQQQQGLANQYQDLANGVGPNPAQAMLAQQTGNNIASQNALMAGQRGAGANAGLIGRQAAMQGANTQQQSVGQASTLQAQQQLGAMSALQQQQAMMGNLASTQVGQQGQALMGYNQAAQGQYNSLLNSMANYNNANVAMQGNINNNNAAIASGNAGFQRGLVGGILNSAGGAGMLGAAHGGMIPPKGMKDVTPYADGGEVDGPQSFTGKFLNGWTTSMAPSQIAPGGANDNVGGYSSGYGAGSKIGGSLLTAGKKFASKYGESGAVPGSDYGMSTESAIPGAELNSGFGSMMSTVPAAPAFSAGGKIQKNLKSGGDVKGKAKFSGDTLKNDTVPAMLSPGEVVIPRSVMNSSDPVSNAAKFVQAVLAKNGLKARSK